VNKILKQISKDIKETARIRGNRRKCIPSVLWKVTEDNRRKWMTIRMQFSRLLYMLL